MAVTEYKVMCVDTESDQIIYKQGEIPGTYLPNTDLLKRLKMLYETDNIKYVNIVTAKLTLQKRGMSEQDFFDKSVNLEKGELTNGRLQG